MLLAESESSETKIESLYFINPWWEIEKFISKDTRYEILMGGKEGSLCVIAMAVMDKKCSIINFEHLMAALNTQVEM